jgi:hypothetical protein
MALRSFPRSWLRLFVVIVGAFALTNCALSTNVRNAANNREATALRNNLVALSPHVRAKEAQRLADCAYITSRQLARDYHVVGPPLFHNFLVNIGMRERGLCFQWARDLFAKLNQVPLQTLELHWGAARAGTWREHNCVVVTAEGQSFKKGIVLDAWRHSGRLFWSRVEADHYPWQEDEAERISLTSKRPRPAATKSTLVRNPLPAS